MADILLILAVIVFSLIGAKRGFARAVVGLVSSILSLIIGAVLYKPLALILTASPIGSNMTEYAKRILESGVENVNKINISDAAVETAATLLINVVSFAVIMLVSKIAIHIAVAAVNIIAKLPVIRQADSILGTVVGAVSGLFICYIVLGVLYTLNDSGFISGVAKSIENSLLAVKFYEGNIVSDILSGFIQ